MGPDLWMLGAVIVLALTQLFVFWYLYRQSQVSNITSESLLDATATGTSEQEADDQVTCPHCGTANDPVFRYCQNCITELPGIPSLSGTAGSQQSRGLS